MKILLVNTNRMKPAVAPIGLDYLADSLRASGHTLSLLDLCFSEDCEKDIEAAVAAFSPGLVGASVRNTDDCVYPSAAFLLPEVRRILAALRDHTDAPIVIGGVGFSTLPEAAMDYCGADFGIAGEGEDAMVRLAAALQGGTDPAAVPGLLWWDEGGIRRNRGAELRLETLPPRERSFIDNRRYYDAGGQAGFETKRGCPMGCIYCADPVSKGRRTRLLPPRMVTGELRALLAQGIDHVHACDCELNLPVDHAREVCQAIIDDGLADRIRWYAYCSVAPFDDELALLFRRAGCAGIDFGADSGNAQMLKRLGRAFTPGDLVSTARSCAAAGIPFMYDLLVGGPGETRETLRDSLDLVRGLGADCVGVSVGARVYEGTPLAAEVRSAGPLESNPALQGARIDNGQFLRPLFYLAPGLGPDIVESLPDLVGHDERFFLPGDYNYNDNERIAAAIAGGARGAYWDILRRQKKRPA
jgi:tryptophan 2-C-methyltransferase